MFSSMVNLLLHAVTVTSGIPQGTVLSLLMFPLYINDISRNITSSLRLFVDVNYIEYLIDFHNDIITLQEDLDRLSE